MSGSPTASAIAALRPHGPGHQFVLYGDACSGVPGAPHERTFAAVNAVVRRLDPPPELIVFAGDEIVGLVADSERLREQWRYWLEHEMSWVTERAIPLWHATGNHTTYDETSENVFRDVLELPDNGPEDQQGLAYWVRDDTLLLVFVHTLSSRLGGEGFVETVWLEEVLRLNADASFKFVIGHHPVLPVNGFSGAYQRAIGPESSRAFWDVLVEHDVLAYLCSHILAFDVQAREGVLQICSAGAGTAHRMPEGAEYLHCVQLAVDDAALRYQVLDVAGELRERLVWPLAPIARPRWERLDGDDCAGAIARRLRQGPGCAFRFTGRAASEGSTAMQTLLCAGAPDAMPTLWIGLRGAAQRLTVIVSPEPGRSPHYWHGPSLAPSRPFDFQLRLHEDMGPGGILHRDEDDDGWSTLDAASPWGLERVAWPDTWTLGHGSQGAGNLPFVGRGLEAFVAVDALATFPYRAR